MGRDKQRYVCWMNRAPATPRLQAQRLVACAAVVARAEDLPALSPPGVVIAPPAGDGDGWFVLAITSRKKPGKWTFPKGGWEVDDGPAATCAVREAFEEAGVALLPPAAAADASPRPLQPDELTAVAASLPLLLPAGHAAAPEQAVVGGAVAGTGCFCIGGGGGGGVPAAMGDTETGETLRQRGGAGGGAAALRPPH